MDKSSEPVCTEVTINVHAGGKVALRDYGADVADYGCSITRKYSIPSEWTDDDVTAFQRIVLNQCQNEVDEKNTPEYVALLDASTHPLVR